MEWNRKLNKEKGREGLGIFGRDEEKGKDAISKGTCCVD